MRSSIVDEKLDPQNLLLLYLADELGPAERRDLEQMLVEQPAVKAELESLRSAQRALDEAFGRLDSVETSINSDAIVRRVGRAMRQELARPRMKLVGEGMASRRRVWPWVLPSAAAASIFVAAAVWVHQHVGQSNQIGPSIVDNRFNSEPRTPTTEPERSEDNLALWLDSFDQDPRSGSDVANSRKVDEDIATVADSQDPVSQYMLNSSTSRG